MTAFAQTVPRLYPRARTAVGGQRILAVVFGSPEGRAWTAIGGGASVAAAIGDARSGCPDGSVWTAVSWNDLYGD